MILLLINSIFQFQLLTSILFREQYAPEDKQQPRMILPCMPAQE